ncbi:transmembrane protein [Ceratobasidium sp. AG-Ba]|nr:transmembrane protein [Ceratobasidium sp. AG-Ba]
MVFWLRDVKAPSLGLSTIRNQEHLRNLLEEQFWVHMEYMPRDDLSLRGATNQLLASLATLAIDTATSAGSVSPFSSEECRAYSYELKQVLEANNTLHINWCTGRIMSLVTQSRTVNLHGEPGARTDRTMVVNAQHPPLEGTFFKSINFILFFAPSDYLRRWNNLWIDRVVYTREWRRFVKELTEEWTISLKMASSGILSVAGVGFSASAGSTLARTLALISTISAVINSAYSLVMITEYRGLGMHAADGAAFIQKHESSTAGLQSLAIKSSIPGAAVIWSSVLLSFSIFWAVALELFLWLNLSDVFSLREALLMSLLVATYMYGCGGLHMRP